MNKVKDVERKLFIVYVSLLLFFFFFIKKQITYHDSSLKKFPQFKINYVTYKYTFILSNFE